MKKLEKFKGLIPDVGKELLTSYLEETSITNRMRLKAQIRSLFEFLDPETTTGDLRKLFDQLPQFKDTMQNILGDLGINSGQGIPYPPTFSTGPPRTSGGERSIRIPDEFRDEIKRVLAEEKEKATQEGGKDDTSPSTE